MTDEFDDIQIKGLASIGSLVKKILGVLPTANTQDIIRIVRETQDAETGKINEARALELAQKLSQLGK